MKKYVLMLAMALTAVLSYAQDRVFLSTREEVKSIYREKIDWEFYKDTPESIKEFGSLIYINVAEDTYKILFFDDDVCFKTVTSFDKIYLASLIKFYTTHEKYVKTDVNKWVNMGDGIEATIEMSEDGDSFEVILEIIR